MNRDLLSFGEFRENTSSCVMLSSPLHPPALPPCLSPSSNGNGQNYEALLRRGNTLIVCVTTSLPLSSPYTLTLTFLSAYRSSDRFGQFRAKGSVSNSSEMWFSIALPSNFPVGKFHYHVHLSTNRGKDVATYHHNKPVAVLFNPWHPGT